MSSIQGDWTVPERYNFSRDVIAKLAATRPNDRAMLWVGPNGEVRDRSFAEVDAAAARAGAVLASVGVRRGDVVLVLMSRELEWWELMLGCFRLGAVPAPGTVQLTSKDIAYRAAEAHARCVVVSADMVDKGTEALADLETARICLGYARSGWLSYQDVAATVEPLEEIADTAANEAALCYFTSGTTGPPKMTMHGHGYAHAHGITGEYWLDLRPGDLHWNLSDTGWAKAAWSSLFAPWHRGAAIFVHHSIRFDPSEALDVLARYPVSTLCAPPTAYRMFVRSALEGRQMGKLRHCVSAGEPLNPQVIDLWKETTGLDIHDGYGQTETVLLCANRPGMVRRGSMGLPAPPFDLAVIDQSGARLPPGQEGDVALSLARGRPPGLFIAYRNDPIMTERAFRNAWYLTGDRAYTDEDGYFWFVGRSDDVILSSGYRIGPFEVESALFEHPAVAASAVVASPDTVRGEVVMAFVVLSPEWQPSDALIEALQEHVKRTTAPYKYPRRIEFVTSLPKTVSGKIRRKELRDQEWRRRASLQTEDHPSPPTSTPPTLVSVQK